MKEPDDTDTGEFALTPAAGRMRQAECSTEIHVEFFGLSHQGLVRANNEDQFLVCRFARQLEVLQTTLDDLPFENQLGGTVYAMVVADGMGGQAAGEVASHLAMHTLLDLVVSTPDWIFRSDDGQLANEISRRSKSRSIQMNQKLLDAVEMDPDLRGFGTTMTAAWNLEQDLFLAHVGDSRAYLFRGNCLHQLTKDHTLAQELVDRGVLAKDDLATNRLRHVLTKCLGGSGNSCQPDIQKINLQDGDRILLCTDGLTEMLPDNVIRETMGNAGSVEATCQLLVEQALEAGGKDNITVIVAHYSLPSTELATREFPPERE
jgi:protein phosphatase